MLINQKFCNFNNKILVMLLGISYMLLPELLKQHILFFQNIEQSVLPQFPAGNTNKRYLLFKKHY